MTRVDFYVGQEGTRKELLACRLAEIAYQRGHKVLIVAPQDQLAALDDLLWTFGAGTFVPHGPYGQDEPVQLAPTEPENGDVLITLSPELPQHAEGFTRVVEIVGGSEAEKSAARPRFRYYREKGMMPTVHTLP
ncbi:MAG: DNA polymerase III subunit chi [Gammaproteobacteria bacterium]|nr:DNA polymerase III subunit chi [Gammaproteobacteria bacterium]